MNKKMYWIIFALMGLALIGLLWFMLPTKVDDYKQDKLPVTVPDGIAEDMPESKREAYQGNGRRSVSTDEYFEMLAVEDDISLISSKQQTSELLPDTNTQNTGTENLRNNGYSAAERVFGPTPVKNSATSTGSKRVMTNQTLSHEDKLEYDRERAEMVRNVITGQGGSSTTESNITDEAKPEDEQIDLNWEQDGSVVFSLDDELSDYGVTYSDAAKRPFRCMFVKNEKLKNGQRVTLRLLENYQDEDTRIPANAHLNAICKIGERLELTVKSIELNGKIIPLNLCAYDTDGIKGIYCPETSGNKNAKKAENDALSTTGSTFGGLVGDIANTIIRTGVNIARSSTGETSVNVSSGYEFFLVKSEKR